MPKYFTDERQLLFQQVTLRPDQLTSDTVGQLFTKGTKFSICVVFEGFEQNCLGYVVHAKKHGDRYELLNIVNTTQLILSTDQALVSVLRHVSGVEYSDAIQRAFHQIRNDIGSGSPWKSEEG